jgi:hypothetical protein
MTIGTAANLAGGGQVSTGDPLADLGYFTATYAEPGAAPTPMDAAIFCEAMYKRWLHGERPGDDFAPTLQEGVPTLLRAASSFARN